ncbi:MAG TPA: PBP1A family penicillin-binding protein [Candidatus Anoxymicrobiaceae bacterium]|jgi:penicillin-binding protein 1A
MKVFLRLMLVVVAGVAIALGGTVVWFYTGVGLPKLSSLKQYKAAQNSKVFAADGTLLGELKGDQDREIIALDQMPEALRQAVCAIEDIDFYKHKGVNWKGVARALWANVVKGGVVQGGSTITQQYIKNAYVGPKRTLWRKIEEARLAYELEQKYSKDKILEMYLNDSYFGQGSYGIFTAARKYFGKAPQDLTLAECAMLAGMLQSPSYYDPYSKPQEVLERRKLVLEQMQRHGTIKRAEMDQANNEPLALAPPNKVYVVRRAPYFCDYITEYMKKKYGDQKVFRGGLRIYTTLDLRLQDMAERTVARMMDPDSGPSAALVCIDPRTGYVKAMVGGKNYAVSQFNVAADGHRQAGSSFKTFVLARAMADSISPDTTYDASSPRIINIPGGGKWVVNNYEGHGSGSTTIREATIRSVNCVYAQMIMDVGPSRVADMAKAMGIQTEVESNPAIALGGLRIGVTPLEMASAYGTLADNGVHAVPRSTSKVTDANGNVIDEGKPETNTVLDPKVAARITGILQQVVSSGTGRGASIGRPQAGKTGTAEDYADAWFVGYTPDLVTAVWVGYPQGRISMGGMTGGSLPASIWANFMEKALDGVPPTPFTSEEGVTPSNPTESESITVTVCDDSGMLATPNCPRTHEKTFRRGEEPSSYCSLHNADNTRKVPNVVGMSSSAARSALESEGYGASAVNQTSAQPAGTVTGQTPAAGTVLPSGGSVTIYVSSGPSQSTVPSVIGLSEGGARTKISTAGFVASVTYVPGSPVGVVVSQSPSAGTRMTPGSQVSVVINGSGHGGGLSALFPWAY